MIRIMKKIRKILDKIGSYLDEKIQPSIDYQRIKEGQNAIFHANALKRYCEKQLKYGCEKCPFGFFHPNRIDKWACNFKPAGWNMITIRKSMSEIERKFWEGKNEQKSGEKQI